jgi:hypothetical protein
LYRSYPPQSDIPRPYHLHLSAAAEAKRAQSSNDLPSGETTESKSPLAEKVAEGKANKNNSSRSSCDSSCTCNARYIFVSVKYVFVSVKLVYVYVKLLKI